jgi:hypothetical protein
MLHGPHALQAASCQWRLPRVVCSCSVECCCPLWGSSVLIPARLLQDCGSRAWLDAQVELCCCSNESCLQGGQAPGVGVIKRMNSFRVLQSSEAQRLSYAWKWSYLDHTLKSIYNFQFSKQSSQRGPSMQSRRSISKPSA